MINVVYQLLRDENKTTVLSVVLVLTLLVSFSAVSINQHSPSGDGKNAVAENDAPVAEKSVTWLEFTDIFSSDICSSDVIDGDIAGTPADLAPYSYVFYSQNYFLESIHARTPAAFALLS